MSKETTFQTITEKEIDDLIKAANGEKVIAVPSHYQNDRNSYGLILQAVKKNVFWGSVAFVDLDKKGQKHGDYKEYSTEGRLLAEGQYVHGAQEGRYRTYNNHNGILKTDATYSKGELHGEFREYWTSGELSKVIQYAHGKRHGRCDEYYGLGGYGMVKTSQHYVDDVLHGPSYEYSRSGDWRKETNYVEGKRQGLCKEYYTRVCSTGGLYNAKAKGLHSEHTYIDDKLHGEGKVYHEDGTLHKKTFFFHGQLLRSAEYNQKGRLVEEKELCRESAGNIYDFKEYDPNDQWYREGKYVAGRREGAFKEYSKDGVLRREGNYSENKFDGTVKNYDKDGSLSGIEIFNKGELDKKGTAKATNALLMVQFEDSMRFLLRQDPNAGQRSQLQHDAALTRSGFSPLKL